MKRIAGVISDRAAAMLHGMAAALTAGAFVDPPTRTKSEPAPGIGFVATSHEGETPIHESSDVVVVMDGTIYNRKDFGSLRSDPALFAELYRSYGFEEALKRINGDFAIALYDRIDRTLWLARDRVGVKPLYFAEKPGLFAFSSRPRPLVELEEIGSAINLRYAAIFAGSHYRYVDNRPEESPYANVAQLPAGHFLCFRNDRAYVSRYWGLADAPDWTQSEDELAERYRSLLLDAVEILHSGSAQSRIYVVRRNGFIVGTSLCSQSTRWRPFGLFRGVFRRRLRRILGYSQHGQCDWGYLDASVRRHARRIQSHREDGCRQ